MCESVGKLARGAQDRSWVHSLCHDTLTGRYVLPQIMRGKSVCLMGDDRGKEMWSDQPHKSQEILRDLLSPGHREAVRHDAWSCMKQQTEEDEKHRTHFTTLSRPLNPGLQVEFSVNSLFILL